MRCRIVLIFVSVFFGFLNGQFMLDVSVVKPCRNPCAENPCENNSTCVQDIYCKPLCLCSEDYFGNKCQHELEDFKDLNKSDILNKSKTLFRVSNDTCKDVGLFCNYGICGMYDDAKFVCHCSKGWTGTHCNVSTDEKQPNAKAVRGITERLSVAKVSSTVSPVTKSTARQSLSNSNPLKFSLEAWSNLKPVFKVPEKIDTIEPPSVENSTLDPAYNVCSVEPLRRPLSERKCPMQMEDQACEYGVCRQELVDHGTWMGHSFTCVCDIGARGNPYYFFRLTLFIN